MIIAAVALFLARRSYLGNLHQPAWAVGALFAGLLRIVAAYVLRDRTGFEDRWLNVVMVTSAQEAILGVVVFALLIRAITSPVPPTS